METAEKWKEDLNEIMKIVPEKPCLADFATDQNYIVTTNESRTELGITLWQKRNDITIRVKAFASRFLNDGEKKQFI